MTADIDLANVTVALLTVVTVLGLTATAAGGAVATTPGDVSAQQQVTDSGSAALWGWWDDDDDEDDDSPWWEDDSPWWEDDDDDTDDGDSGDDDSGDGDDDDTDDGDDDSSWWDDSPWWDDGDDDDSDDSDDGDSDDGDSGDNETADPAPAAFQLSGVASNSPVTEGETLTVDATVENTGNDSGTQTVDFAVDGFSDSQSVTLDAGASTTVTFEWTTQDGDAGSYTATIESANDTATTDVTVESPAPEPTPASFDVSVASTNSPVTEGEALEVTATVTNTGEQDGTQTVELASSGSTLDSQDVTLAAGASQQVTLSWTTGSGDAGSYDLTVSSANASATASVTVEAPAAPASFGVSVTGSNSPVTEGETLTVDATVENTGEQSDTQTVDLDVGGGVQDSQEVTLGAGESQTITLSWTTGSGDAGDYTATVSSADDSATTSVTVDEPAAPANFGVSADSSNSPVTAGEALDVTATITNDGEQSGTQTIELNVAGGVQDSQSVSLGAGESQTITLSWQTAEGDAGDYTATVSSDDASSQTAVTVEAATTIPSNFTTVVEDGYIQLGTGTEAYRINLTECPNGEAPSSDVQCQTATATVDSETGNFTIASEDLDFGTTVNVDVIGEIAVQMNAPNGLTGTADWESGDVTLNGELKVFASDFGSECGATTTISATTGTEGPLTGSTFNVSDRSPAAGTLVDSTYSVPAVTGCPTDYTALGLNVNDLANSQLGLPSDSGNNRLVMDLHMEYEE
ncbi:CARDB domain-containing protein [Halorientalis halophila]|uniref:CARDB domain-containing protein n=1 Tax=Halorientalis halophila TaxID=3108499 RepID=UPI00300AF694